MADTFYDFRYDFVGSDWVDTIISDVEIISAEDEYVQIILLRLLIPRGSYALNPELGSDLHLLKNFKATSISNSEIKKMVDAALKPEIDAGNIGDVVVESQLDNNDGVKIKITAEVIGGDSINVNLLLGT